jgi:hypothetical protein
LPHARRAAQLDEESDPVCFKADPKMSFAHPYPPTKLMFIPDKASARVTHARAPRKSGGQGFSQPHARGAQRHARRCARIARASGTVAHLPLRACAARDSRRARSAVRTTHTR